MVIFLKGVELSGIEDFSCSRHTRCHKVRLDDGVVARVELEDDDIADGGGDVVRRVLMRVFFWTYFDGMRSVRGRRGWSHGCRNRACCVCRSGLEEQ